MKAYVRYAYYFMRLILILFVSLIPKNKKIWVFGAWFGRRFSDNSKYFFNYIVKNNRSNIKAVWICKDKDLITKTKKTYGNDVAIYYHLSFLGIYYQAVSSIAFVGHSINTDLNGALIGLTTKRIQLWHGVPLKKIGFDDELTYRPWHKTILYKLLINNHYTYAISTGKKVSKLFSTAFNMSVNDIIETGFPRNDVFRSPKGRNLCCEFKAIYMPTFRDQIGDEISLFDTSFLFDLDKLISCLKNNNIILTLRTHPANNPPKDLIDKIEGCKYIRLCNADDIYESINDYDCLITDYSSIMFDFCLSGKPIVFSPFDFDKYLEKDRKMYFDYSWITDGYPVVRNWNELIDVLNIIRFDKHQMLNNGNVLKFHDAELLTEDSFSKKLERFIMDEWYK